MNYPAASRRGISWSYSDIYDFHCNNLFDRSKLRGIDPKVIKVFVLTTLNYVRLREQEFAVLASLARALQHLVFARFIMSGVDLPKCVPGELLFKPVREADRDPGNEFSN